MLPYFPFGTRFNDKIGTAIRSENEPLIDVDEHYRSEIALKRQLLTEQPDYYFQAFPGYETAQWEVTELVLSDLVRRGPESFSLRKQGDDWQWENRLLGESVAFRFGETNTLLQAPLDWVGRQVQEDLVMLAGEGPRLVAGQLCFGNVWSLDEKMGLPFWEIHAPITPIVEPMMRAAQNVMERLPVGRPVWRLNWSIKASDQLDMTTRRMPELNAQLAALLPRLTPDNVGEHLFIRIEKQTLTRLPRSGAILFGIRTYQNRLDCELAELAERPDAAQRLLNVLTTTPPAMLDYKGISPYLSPLLTYLKYAYAHSHARIHSDPTRKSGLPDRPSGSHVGVPGHATPQAAAD